MTEQQQNPEPPQAPQASQAPQAPQATQPPPYAGQQPPPYRRLTRTSWDAPVSGVCGGVARYLGVDPTLVRVLAAIAMVLTFPAGPIVYLVMWAVMPRE